VEDQGGKNISTFILVYLIFSPQNNSDVLELEPLKIEDQPNVTPDSSTTVNSKSDLDNSLIMFQVMVTVCTSHL